MSKEEKIQNKVSDYLQKHNIYPFNIVFSYSAGISSGILSITLFIEIDLDEILDLLDYKYQCDKTGYSIIRDSYNTILLSGFALDRFLKTIG